MNNPWTQGILCSLIAATLYGGISRYFRSGYPRTLLLVGVSVSTVVFSFGNILEPAVKLLLEGESPYWSLLMAFREYAPGYLVLGFFVGGLLPGIVTGLMVVKGDSLIRRLQYALFWSPISLSFFDAIAYVLLWQSDIIELRALANWGNVYFSLLSNIFGGMAGGLIIGSVVHLIVEIGNQDHLPNPSTPGLTRGSNQRR